MCVFFPPLSLVLRFVHLSLIFSLDPMYDHHIIDLAHAESDPEVADNRRDEILTLTIATVYIYISRLKFH